ncbi:hypothetical protein IKF02_03970 [Candidatus Saccharibacteria bacterium]|nr:hypothetical protein [Candidatus Saccharibacteria bacterium]MBR3143845.1 hypothetical protein [Candidatus Saccharibacteria bacterium]
MLDNETRQFAKRLIVAFCSLIFITLIIFILIIPSIEYIGRPAFLDVLVTPLDSVVQINGEIYSNGVYEFEPGIYFANISKDGFESKTIEIELEKNKTTSLYIYLEQNDGGWEYYQERYNEQSLDALLKINGYGKPVLEPTDHDDSGSNFIHTMSIQLYTPIYFSICGEPASRMNCDSISVDYGHNKQCGNKPCLIITGRRKEINQETLAEVGAELEQRGFSLNDYEYVYMQDADR